MLRRDVAIGRRAAAAQSPRPKMMVFCEECNHTMSPQEDKASKSLYYVCRTCKHKIEAENTKVYARIVTGKKEYVSRARV